MDDYALNVSVRQDTLGRFLSFAQLTAQGRIIDELLAERQQIHHQIAAIEQSNLIAGQVLAIEEKRLAIEQKRLELEENERKKRIAELERLRHLRNILAEATLELEGLQSDLHGEPAS